MRKAKSKRVAPPLNQPYAPVGEPKRKMSFRVSPALYQAILDTVAARRKETGWPLTATAVIVAVLEREFLPREKR